MELFNRSTEEDVIIPDNTIKDIMEWILDTSSKGTNYVCMRQLDSTKEGYFIVAESWMLKNKNSGLAYEILENKIKLLENKLNEINKLSTL